MKETMVRRLTHFAEQLKNAGFVSVILAFMDERFAWDFERFSEFELEELEKIFHSMEDAKQDSPSLFSISINQEEKKPSKKQDIKAVAEVSPEEKKSKVKEVKKEIEPEVVEYEATYNNNVKVISERIDRNGTKHQEIIEDCSRCSGKGASKMWAHTGSTCYKCGGNGKQSSKRKIYTVKHAEKLRVQREKRAEKKRQEIIAQAVDNNKIQMEKWGYAQKRIFAVLGDTYQIKDELKDAGAYYGGRHIGWYFSEKPSKWETFELEVEQLVEYNLLGEVYKKGSLHGEESYNELISYVNSERKKLEPVSNSNWIGEVGERKDFELKVISSFGMDTAFGWSCINRLQDAEGNTFIWKTDRDLVHMCGKGETIELKGTIKEHSEYKEEKQTVLTRCKIKD